MINETPIITYVLKNIANNELTRIRIEDVNFINPSNQFQYAPLHIHCACEGSRRFKEIFGYDPYYAQLYYSKKHRVNLQIDAINEITKKTVMSVKLLDVCVTGYQDNLDSTIDVDLLYDYITTVYMDEEDFTLNDLTKCLNTYGKIKQCCMDDDYNLLLIDNF